MSNTALKAAASNDPNKPRAFPEMIDQLKKQVALALPKHLNADRMARIALTAFNQNRELAECHPISIFASVITAAQLGLEPGVNGQGYLIPYKGVCTFVPGWKGLVDLAQRSGRSSVWTGAVFEGDVFTYDYGTSPSIHHEPKGEDDPKKLRFVYAIGRVKGAEFPVIEVWPIAKVLKHRDRYNKVGARHYSFKNIEMYARKVALLQVLKYMPSTVELTAAISIEHAALHGASEHDAIDLQKAIDGSFMQFVPVPDPDEPDVGSGPSQGASEPSQQPATGGSEQNL